ncbi:MAG: ubiquinol-cytochrome c reductase iron-sulfur subunit [Gammaproteobacteria bacterium]|nr:MAG: ubiquinol-cytochrome c reductase iron-sulfur subunit [Gammaproteobacteria bacterium]RKZ91989.1 MAG: ubiquinol-cytochrome c reductase iron-sulfur subunit [Gammaproteobacteria bacterium]RKZ98065.1 MAG: ubiquinol-cytochrome c reductase iron-sulfur subunit [Gammaproteobacteria bacterium]RLA01159.1 MAG: ubiquinol-cytochrome c reductase iron-sulfur subunit [Gammaproteobacteria bacterium]
MSSTVDNSKRRFLTTAASVVVGGAGAAAVAVPFVTSMLPSAKAQAAGAPIDVDISKLEIGQQMTVEWRGKPVWIVRRSTATIESLASLDEQLRDPGSSVASQQPEYCVNETRSIRDELIVLVGVCTHLGCSPTYRPELAPEDLGSDWKGGFFCPCHGSKFDLAGRVYKGVPAPTNLVVPPYYFQGDNRIVVGEDAQGAA